LVVEVPVVGVEAEVVVFGPVLDEVGAPVVRVVGLGALVDVVTGVTGFGGATSWRSTPPGHAKAPATAATATTPNAIGNTSFS
jgi:hypothetical protein